MPHDKQRPYDGGPANPGINQEVHLQPDETRPYQIVKQPMNGMSVRDVATLQILSALISARCSLVHRSLTMNEGFVIPQGMTLRPEWIVEAMDAADTWLEMREQI